jgi:transglutaminase-like putative cysteine protease
MKFFKSILIIFVVAILLPTKTSAQDFFTSSEVTYEVSTGEDTKVSHEITIRNNSTEVHATNYTLSLRGAKVSNVKAFEGNTEHSANVAYEDGVTKIQIIFDGAIVGENAERTFSIEYIDSSLARATGEVSEISIPRLLNESQYSSYLVRLKIPNDFGRPAYMSPEPDSELAGNTHTTYYFDQSAVNKAGVTAAFGESQIFSFDLNYHLQNPLALPTKMEIPIPPDTSFQKVFFDSLAPLPDSVYKDADGNWIASYNLAARERVDVRALGSVQIFSSPWKKEPLGEITRASNLSASEYWQVDDPRIKELAADLKRPRAIYDYVVGNLSYDYDKVTEGVDRLGGVGSLENPTAAICTEFTDLFITLARAAGIPAREVNGYAYTDNEILQPLSLVADVLHAWPEYWDDEKGAWIPVDPTWGNTTGGIDYFDKLDMRHFSFVMHGQSATEPIPPGSYKLGANPQKDVYVSFGETTERPSSKINIDVNQRTTLPFQGIKLVAEIKNPGPSALYNQNIDLFFEGQSQFQRTLNVILPFETRALEFTIPYGFFGTKMPTDVKLLVGTETYDYKTSKKPAVVRDIVVIMFVLSAAGMLSYLILKRK